MTDRHYYDKISDYRGFEIFQLKNGVNRRSYYFIGKDNERFSCLCLNSPKAATTVIDTHLKNETKPIYK